MQRSCVGVTAPKQYGGVVMDIILRHCAGGDVHKKFVVVCRRWIDEQGRVHKEVRRFSTMTADLEALRDWLVATDQQGVAAQAILRALLAGQDDPHALANPPPASCARSRPRWRGR